MPSIIELRSDTFTKPTAGMLQAMFAAEVGDDVFEEDPTTNELENYAAKLFGYEAALFCTSGTMANQIAIKAHTQPGHEVICDSLSHIYLYEGGGIAANSGVSTQLIDGDRGRISAAQIEEHIKVDNVHYPVSSLVSLENTVNKGGGCIYDITELQKIKSLCQEYNMALHLDGARLFNALVATGETPQQHGALFDSISICLSKGLGAPVGSVLMGSRAYIHQARRVRKRFGGGWRQSGFLAAAGLYALQHQVTRLAEDHAHAQALGKIFSNCTWVQAVVPIETNIVIINLKENLLAQDYVQKMEAHGIKCMAFGKDKIRAVTHHDFSAEDLQQCEKIIPTIK
jgi:threonine aldolase